MQIAEPRITDIYVALRKESVDRNLHMPALNEDEKSVALRKESVDRNLLPVY